MNNAHGFKIKFNNLLKIYNILYAIVSLDNSTFRIGRNTYEIRAL